MASEVRRNAERYRLRCPQGKPVYVDAVRLGWDTWTEGVCDLVDVGSWDDGQPEGCWVHPATGRAYFGPGIPVSVSIDTVEIGLMIPSADGGTLVREGDWIILDADGELYPCKPDAFATLYVAADDGQALG